MLLSLNRDYTFIFAEASNAEEAVGKIKEKNFDIAIVNYTHPKLSGLELTSLFLHAKPDLKIIVLRNQYDFICTEVLMNSGVKGCVLKDICVDELYKAVETVIQGGSYCFAGTTNCNANFAHNSGKIADLFALFQLLSRRELEVLKYIVEENTNEEIGAKLFISKRTVDTHRQNLLHKLGCKNTAGLVKYAIELKLIE